MSTEQHTAVTVVERAKLALRAPEYETRLVELAAKSKAITTITNADGYKEAHAARMELKRQRVELEKLGKGARDDAQKFARAVIDEQNRLVDIILPEEERLQALQDKWDAEREADRQAKIKAEQARVDGIKAAIEAIERRALRIVGMPASRMQEEIDHLAGLEVTPALFAEFVDAAKAALASALAAMRDAHAKQVAAEAEAERIKAEREELARLRKAEEERQAAERARLAEEQRQADEARAKADAEARAAREKAEAEQRERLRQEAEAQRKRVQAEEEERRKVRERQEEEARARKAAEDARLAAEQKRIDEERAELRRQQERAAEEERQRKAKAEAERLQMVTSDPVRALREVKALLQKGGNAEALLVAISNVVFLAVGRIDAVEQEAA